MFNPKLGINKIKKKTYERRFVSFVVITKIKIELKNIPLPHK